MLPTASQQTQNLLKFAKLILELTDTKVTLDNSSASDDIPNTYKFKLAESGNNSPNIYFIRLLVYLNVSTQYGRYYIPKHGFRETVLKLEYLMLLMFAKYAMGIVDYKPSMVRTYLLLLSKKLPTRKLKKASVSTPTHQYCLTG